MTPDSPTAPVETARPNSTGPLHFCLKENIQYQLSLLKTPHLEFKVTSSLNPAPQVDIVTEHENLHTLIWGNIDFKQFSNDQLIVTADDKVVQKISIHSLPKLEIKNRPLHLRVQIENGPVLFRITTNLQENETVHTVLFKLNRKEQDFFLSTVVKVTPGWNVRAETTPFYQNHSKWWEQFLAHYPKTDASRIIGSFCFNEDDSSRTNIRTFGFGCRINDGIVQMIQEKKGQVDHTCQTTRYKLQLQITSAHREFYKTILQEKNYPEKPDNEIIGFNFEEVVNAQRMLHRLNPHVAWEHSFLELVLWFKCEGREWQEFQREIAYSYRWDFIPGVHSKTCQCKWSLWDLELPEHKITLMESGQVFRDFWPAKVVLKPYHDKKLLAWWDLDKPGVSFFIKKEWNVSFENVGFYLKIHEEYLGNRIHRADLDCFLLELFSSHQSAYFDIDDNKCYTAEIVARYEDRELALTPISNQQVAPRSNAKQPSETSITSKCSNHWHHTSQREVKHQHGKDRNNIAKVLFHFHMHSPNLFRADPFRESFLKDKTWPIQTADGVEVHNVPGEWVMKNCMDSWLPLLRVFRTLGREQIDFQTSLNISPPVAYTLSSGRFKDYMSRYLARVRSHIETQIKVMTSQQQNPDFIWAADRYLEDVRALEVFYHDELGKNIIGAFRELELQGFLEIQTCTATHGMPGLLESTPDSLDTQIALAARSHHRIFGARPKGIWLAENSFFPGIERFLYKEDLQYFFVEAEAVLKGSVCPREEEYNPVKIPQSNIVAFGRSRLGRTQVWDAKIGYAGHPDFREYHFRHFGLPLKRITSKTSNEKQPYNPDQAQKTAQKLACDFHQKLSTKARELSQQHFTNQPLITCTYDAELFGHHWAEGPQFIEELFREFYRKNDKIGLTTPSHYLVNEPVLPESVPNPSTWGHETFHMRWSDPKVSWTFRELERADELLRRYRSLARENQFKPFQNKLVEQMGAELVRAQSSDLTFVIISGDFEEDMQREIQKYLDYFYRLKSLIDNKIENQAFIKFRQYENDMFPEFSEYLK